MHITDWEQAWSKQAHDRGSDRPLRKCKDGLRPGRSSLVEPSNLRLAAAASRVIKCYWIPDRRRLQVMPWEAGRERSIPGLREVRQALEERVPTSKEGERAAIRTELRFPEMPLCRRRPGPWKSRIDIPHADRNSCSGERHRRRLCTSGRNNVSPRTHGIARG
jgi:hypothetical protein